MQLFQILAAVWFGLYDICRAVLEVIVRRQRSLYSASIDIRAPRDRVWELLMRDDTTFKASGLHSIQQFLPNRPDAYVATMSVHGKLIGRIGCERLLAEPPQRLVVRYLPEHSDSIMQIGDNDCIVMALQDVPTGGTRLEVSRELGHTRFATRILAPSGLRNFNWMLRAQAELEAGVPAAAPRWWHHVLWSFAAFASFAWLFDTEMAAIILLIIAVHEGGHALAMLRYGLGVQLLSFIPFFGGIAVPRRMATTEWQSAMVALAGVGFSLPFVLAAIWWAQQYDSRFAAELAMFSAAINAANLLPVPGLDGSAVLSSLLRKVHRFAAQGVAWIMFGAFAAYAVTTRDPVMGAVVAFSLLVLVQSSVLKLDSTLKPMGVGQSATMFALYSVISAAYVALCFWAFAILGAID